jgi:hypothetical protein
MARAGLCCALCVRPAAASGARRGRKGGPRSVHNGGAGRENMREMAGGSHGGFVYFGVGASRARNQALGRPAYEWEKIGLLFLFLVYSLLLLSPFLSISI